MNKKTYHIKGMHCHSCEIMIEDHVSKIAGVQKVAVNYRNGRLDVHYDARKPADHQIEQAVRNAGYEFGVDAKKPFFARNPFVYVEFLYALGAFIVLFTILKFMGVLDFNLGFSATPGYLVVLLIGLTAGVSTCMALIGGLVLGIATRHAELHPEATASQKFRPHLFFNVGRILSYALLGGMIGLLGSAFRLSSPVLGVLIIAVGIVMLLLGLKLTELFPRLSSGGLMLPKRLSRLLGLGSEVKEYSHKGAFITGALTFFLPCGFTQAMQLYAISTGSFGKGALIMALFALGTMPGLLGIGGLTSIARGSFARYFFKFASIVIIVLGVSNIANGYNLTGITLGGFDQQNQAQAQDGADQLEDGKQIVRITQSASGYSPRQVTVKKGIPVKLLVNATNLYSCSASLVIPKYRIATSFKEGLNEIEFTPTEVGPVKFSCSMGMYTGVINVIN